MTPPDIVWLPLLPILIVTGTSFVVLLADLFVEGPDREGLGWIGLVGLGAAAVASALLWTTKETAFAEGIALDRYALFFNFVICLTGALTLLMSMDYLHTINLVVGEYYVQLLLAVVGMMLMAAATDLIVLFLGLELMSISVYVLAGIWRPELRSSEAALKYFLLGAFASGFLLYGIAMAYGAFGTTTLGPIGAQIDTLTAEQRPLALAAVGLLLVGFAFKVAAVPFHAWAPDVYEGAPTSVTALMAVGVKAAAFAAFTRVFLHTLGAHGGRLVGDPVDPRRADHDRRQRRRTRAAQHQAHAGLLEHRPRRLPAGRHGGRRRERRRGGAVHRAGLRADDAGRLRRGDRHRAARRAERGHRRLRRARLPLPVPRRLHDRVHALARRHPVARRLHRQVLPLQRRGRAGLRLAGDHRRAQQHGVDLLLRRRAGADVHGRGHPRGAGRIAPARTCSRRC